MSICKTNAQIDNTISKNSIYIGGGRQGLTYLKYERLLFKNNWTQTVTSFGLGGRPGDTELGEPRLIKLLPDIIQLFGFKSMFIEIGIEPSFNFEGSLSYTELNGIVGLRYQNRHKKQATLFGHIGYNPRIYRTHQNEINVPLYFGIGLTF